MGGFPGPVAFGTQQEAEDWLGRYSPGDASRQYSVYNAGSINDQEAMSKLGIQAYAPGVRTGNMYYFNPVEDGGMPAPAQSGRSLATEVPGVPQSGWSSTPTVRQAANVQTPSYGYNSYAPAQYGQQVARNDYNLRSMPAPGSNWSGIPNTSDYYQVAPRYTIYDEGGGAGQGSSGWQGGWNTGPTYPPGGWGGTEGQRVPYYNPQLYRMGGGDAEPFYGVSPMSTELTNYLLNYLGANVGMGATPFGGQLSADPNALLRMLYEGAMGGQSSPGMNTLNWLAQTGGESPFGGDGLPLGTLGLPGMDTVMGTANNGLGTRLQDVYGTEELAWMMRNGGLPVDPTALPGGSTMQSFAQGGQPVDAIPAWQSMVEAQQRNIDRRAADLKGQFAFSGNLASSPMAGAMTDFYTQASKDQNALLGEMQLQAMEAARQRQYGAGSELMRTATGARESAMGRFMDIGQFLTGTQAGLNEASLNRQIQAAQFAAESARNSGELAKARQFEAYQSGLERQLNAGRILAGAGQQLGEIFQGLDQAAIDRTLAEFIRTRPEYGPLLNMIFAMATTFPPIVNTKFGLGATGAILANSGNIASGIGDIISATRNRNTSGGTAPRQP